jgi:hypothetical protein
VLTTWRLCLLTLAFYNCHEQANTHKNTRHLLPESFPK